MMQMQIFFPVVLAQKCLVNMISTLHLTFIYTYLLSLQSITFTSAQCRGKHGANLFV